MKSHSAKSMAYGRKEHRARRIGRLITTSLASVFAAFHSAFRTPHGSTELAEVSALRIQRGFTYTALLAAIVIIGISLGSAGKYWQNISLREKEEELLFRGDQYVKAIENYYKAIPGRMQYPPSIDYLIKDSRSATGKRHLRRKFIDPITGEEFVEIRDLTRRIIGVHSSSEKEPLKKANFPDQYKEFEGKTKYREWIFQFKPTTPLGRPGGSQPLPNEYPEL